MSEESILQSLVSKHQNIIIAGVFLAVVVSSLGYYFYFQARSDPQQSQKKETETLVASVGKLMLLPSDEEPIIATVADPEKLKGQAFFIKAKKGDKVLIYNKARKAILYDPIANHIVDVAPLSIAE